MTMLKACSALARSGVMEDVHAWVHRIIVERHCTKGCQALNSTVAQFGFVCCGPLGVLFGLAVGTFIARLTG
jgi:hypothetical protein